MKVTFTSEKIDRIKMDLLVLPYRQKDTNRAFDIVDHASSGLVSQVRDGEGFKGQKDRTLVWQGELYGQRTRVMLVGVGEGTVAPETWRLAIARSVRYASAHSLKRIAVLLDSGGKRQQIQEMGWTVEGLILGGYSFKKYKTRKTKSPSPREAVCLCTKVADERTCATAFNDAKATAAAVTHARDLVNEPANILSPSELADRAKELAASRGLSCKIFNKKDIQRMGMNLLLSVAAGSSRSPRLIHLSYQPKRNANRPVVLVGKGVTFDSGGLCIKPAKSMYEMKTDMAGAAAVLGIMSALKVLKIGVPVHAIIPATDNAINGNATRPGDVFKTRTGKTVEILNTDAEGRLILADALSYACELKPRVIIDYATLTGACEVALGSFRAGLFSKREEDAKEYVKAAGSSGELLWQLPLACELEGGIKSPVADITNTGPRWGGAITAALFLQHFTADVPWMHLDIAGPARADKATPICPKGGTGYGVLTALAYLKGLQA